MLFRSVNCDDIIDLRTSGELNKLDMTASDLASGWEFMVANKLLPPTWELATCLIKNKCAGLITPSFARNAPAGAANLVLWKWSENLPHQVKLIDDHHLLPKDQSSWT